MKKTLFYLLAAALLFGLGSKAHAQDDSARADAAKPLLVVSVTSVDKLLENAKTLGDIAGAADQVQFLLFMANEVTKGIDTTKPWGAMVNVTAVVPTGFAFVPVTDFEAVMDKINATDGGNGIYEVNAAPVPLFIKHHNGWAFIGNQSDALDNLPDDPSQLLAGQEKEYDIAVRAFIKNIPDLYRDMAIGALKAGIDQANQKENETEDEFQTRKKIGKASIKQIVTLIEETDNITIGWSVDKKERKTFLDVNLSAVPGSKMAKHFAELENSTSNFAGFLQADAAVTFNLVAKIASEDAAQVLATLKVAREQALSKIDSEAKLHNAAARQAIKSVVGDLMDALAATIEGGKIDAAGALVLKPDAMTFAAGGHVNDATKVEGALKKLVKLAENEPNFPGIKFDAASHKGVRFHTMSIPMDDADEEARRLIGERLDVALGFGNQSVYMAAGKDAVQTLKDAIDKSAANAGKIVPPAQMTFALGPILKFAAVADPDNPINGFLASAIEEFKGKDRIRIVVRPIKNGASYRFEVEEGVLGVIGKVAAEKAGAGGF